MVKPTERLDTQLERIVASLKPGEVTITPDQAQRLLKLIKRTPA